MGGGMGGGPFGSGGGGGFGAPFGGSAGMNGHGGCGAQARRPKKDAPHEMELPCSLEELYKGTTRRMKIRRAGSAGWHVPVAAAAAAVAC